MTGILLYLFYLLSISLIAQTPPGCMKTESFSGGRAENIATRITELPGQPPRITYGTPRQSKDWIVNQRGSRVAIDEGIAWQSRKAHVTLTYDLLVMDAKTRKVLWSDFVGAFWDTITFQNLAKPGQPEKWTVVLSSSRLPGCEQPYDLESGKKLPLRGGPAAPDGQLITPRKVWSGSGGISNTKSYQIINSVDEWKKWRGELFGKTPGIPDADEIDFKKESLLVCYAGKSNNWAGIDVEQAFENEQRILIRLYRKTYQSLGKSDDEYPYGLIILPKRTGKEIVLEYNHQNYIGGPAQWKSFVTLK